MGFAQSFSCILQPHSVRLVFKFSVRQLTLGSTQEKVTILGPSTIVYILFVSQWFNPFSQFNHINVTRFYHGASIKPRRPPPIWCRARRVRTASRLNTSNNWLRSVKFFSFRVFEPSPANLRPYGTVLPGSGILISAFSQLRILESPSSQKLCKLILSPFIVYFHSIMLVRATPTANSF